MRWLFLILLTINLLLFFWNWQLPDQDDRYTDVEVSEVGNLKLLSERETARFEPSSEEIELAGVPTVSQKNDGSDEQVNDEAFQDPGTTEPDDPLIAENEDPTTKSKDPGIAESVPETPESPVVVDLNSPPSIYVETATPDAGLEEPEIPVSFCGTLGPLPEGEIVQSAVETLEDRGIKASLRRETIKQQAGFWVIIPPYKSRNAAVEAVKRLKELGFTDIWRFYKGEFRNGISLGMYSRKRNAETRRKSIVETGFFPEVLPRYRDVVMHWIDYRVEGEENLSGLDIVMLAYPELKQEKAECPHIAAQQGIF